MPIRLAVPLVRQDQSMECWYASACMVGYYFAAGPRLGLPVRWQENDGLNPTLGDFMALGRTEHLTPVIAANRIWTEPALERILRDFGPIWCAGYWYGPGHVVVLTGVDLDTVFINDPDGPAERQGTIEWFNQKLAKTFTDCLLRHVR